MLTNRHGVFSALAIAMLVCLGCAQTQAAQQARTDAKTKGKYKVRLTTDAESVVGVCKFVMMIEPQQDPVGMVSESQYPDYFRTEAVYKGAGERRQDWRGLHLRAGAAQPRRDPEEPVRFPAPASLTVAI
jgi:hypothetical protein